MKSKKLDPQPLVCIIRDTRDASLDYYIPYVRAKQLFEEGKLAYDLTNGCYCHPTGYQGPKL